jgi:hypothetical protein
MKVKFFVEDKAHVKFLIDYIEEHFQFSLTDADFYKLSSWSGYKEGGKAFPDYEQNTNNDIINITILDADNNPEGRRNIVKSDFDMLNIRSHLFLFPNDNLVGAIETMLSEIAVDRKIIRCFETYERCIEGYQKPVKKSKIFAYLDALLEEKYKKTNRKDLLQEQNRNYRNTEHWNLNHEYLQPLYDFLIPFFEV